MVQDQLVEYVSSQLKLGISRDAVKTALVGVGWAPLDVEDTLKKVEGTTTAAPAQPAAPQKTPDVSMGASSISQVRFIFRAGNGCGTGKKSGAASGSCK